MTKLFRVQTRIRAHQSGRSNPASSPAATALDIHARRLRGHRPNNSSWVATRIPTWSNESTSAQSTISSMSIQRHSDLQRRLHAENVPSTSFPPHPIALLLPQKSPWKSRTPSPAVVELQGASTISRRPCAMAPARCIGRFGGPSCTTHAFPIPHSSRSTALASRGPADSTMSASACRVWGLTYLACLITPAGWFLLLRGLHLICSCVLSFDQWLLWEWGFPGTFHYPPQHSGVGSIPKTSLLT
jgi:hypothetical protein